GCDAVRAPGSSVTLAAHFHRSRFSRIADYQVADMGNKSDRIDARKLGELLRTKQLKPVYHEEHGIRALRELGRSYLTVTKDVTRVMNRIKALYRSWGIPCSGTNVYAPRHRAEWLAKIVEPGVRVRAEHLY